MPKLVKVLDVRNLPHVRVTGIKHFTECPYSWSQSAFEVIGRTNSLYSRIGTAVHLCVEKFLRREHEADNRTDLWFHWVAYLRSQGVPDEEVENLYRYLQTLRDERDGLLACEFEFILQMIGFGLPIMGHMDFVRETLDGSLEIVDHKTNRSYQDRDWWSQQYQQLLYSWAARMIWPNYPRYRFRIGYVNLGQTVEWETSPSDDTYLRERMAGIWAEMLEYSDANVFPERFGDYCGFCGVRNECSTFRNAMQGMKDDFLEAVRGKTLAEQYKFAVDVRKAAERVEKELKLRLSVELQSSPALAGPGFEIVLEQGSRRQADPWPVWQEISQAMLEYPHLQDEVHRIFEEIFSAKVTGIDAMGKRHPGLKSLLELHIRQVPNSEPTVKIKPLKALPEK